MQWEQDGGEPGKGKPCHDWGETVWLSCLPESVGSRQKWPFFIALLDWTGLDSENIKQTKPSAQDSKKVPSGHTYVTLQYSYYINNNLVLSALLNTHLPEDPINLFASHQIVWCLFDCRWFVTIFLNYFYILCSLLQWRTLSEKA